ncbi:MAG: DUF3108 domain-containing protein [Acidobacteriota bacterium]
MKKLLSLVVLVLFLAPISMAADGGNTERLNYSWHLRGGLSWLARLAFPSSGRGTLETKTADTVNSRLTINASDTKGYYLYESNMVPEGTQTLMSRSAYAYKSSARDERVSFDVDRGLARVQKTTDEGTEVKVHKLESAAPQDVLTSIYYLRQHADEIHAPRQAQIFSGAKQYDVVYQPLPTTTMRVGNTDMRVRPFTIKATGTEAKRFPGEVRVWLSDDGRRIPVRIDIDQKYATLKLDLQTAG